MSSSLFFENIFYMNILNNFLYCAWWQLRSPIIGHPLTLKRSAYLMWEISLTRSQEPHDWRKLTRTYLTKLFFLALFGCFVCSWFPHLHGDPTGLINGTFSDQTNTFVCQGRYWRWLSQTKIYFFLRVLTTLALWRTQRKKTPQARGQKAIEGTQERDPSFQGCLGVQ